MPDDASLRTHIDVRTFPVLARITPRIRKALPSPPDYDAAVDEQFVPTPAKQT
jgi:hypothetical protein